MRSSSSVLPVLMFAFAVGARGQDADRGTPRPANDRASDVACNVEKGGTILSLLPERQLVKKGDVVCELDASDLRERLADLVIAVKRAEADHRYARAAREIADLAVTEYLQGVYPKTKGAIWSRIKLAESEMARAADQLDQTSQSYEKGAATKARKVVDELMYQKAKFDLEIGQSELNHYENFGKAGAIKRLKAAAVKAADDEEVAREVLELAKARERKTRRQIEAGRMTAPCDGRVAYAARLPGLGEGIDPVPIREGDRVRERQVVFRVIPASP